MGSIVRRIQFTGKSTYIVSLPKEWVKSLGITKGSKVFLEIMPDNSIRIRPEPRLSEVSLTKIVDLSMGVDVNTAMREITAAYVAGYENFRIVFNSRSLEAARKLRSLIDSKLANLILVEESGDSLTFKVIGPPKPLSAKDATSWISRLVNTMMSDLLRGVKERDLGLLEVVRERDDLVDKAYIMSVRQLTRALMGEVTMESIGLITQAEALHYYHAFKTLERIADHISNLAIEARRFIEGGARIESSIVKILDEISSTLRNACEALVKLDVETARSIALQVEVLKTKLTELSMKIEGTSGNLRYDNILNSVGRILSYTLDLAEITFDIKSVRSIAEILYE